MSFVSDRCTVRGRFIASSAIVSTSGATLSAGQVVRLMIVPFDIERSTNGALISGGQFGRRPVGMSDHRYR